MTNSNTTTQFTVQHAAKLANAQNGSASFGPLTISWAIDLSIPQISVSASIFGTSLGSAVINPSNPSITLGGSVGVASATAVLTANFAALELDYNIDVEVLGSTIFNKSGTLFTW